MTRIGPLFDSESEHSEETNASLAEATRICNRLRECGHVAYFAGGCVRDALLGREPKDFDVATDATPDRVREIFGKPRTLAFGASFGVIAVLPPRGQPPGDPNPQQGFRQLQPTEVATFRSDGQYSDGRRPDKVHYGDARHDALRRDFTINGLFFDPASETVIDFVGGQADLAARRLRTIGAAEERFEEDKLRMLRAIRFATTLGFDLDCDTRNEIVRRAEEIAVVSAERVGAEMHRLVVSVHAPRGLQLLSECQLDRLILPEFRSADAGRLESFLVHRPSLHFEVSLALIILAIAEGNSALSVETLAANVARLWRLSGEQTRRIRSALTRWPILADAHQRKWSSVQPVLVDRDVEFVLDVAAAVVAADRGTPAGIERCRQSLGWSNDKLNPDPLVTGETLREAGYQAGPDFRRWLQSVRDLQLDGQLCTTQEALEFIARDWRTAK